MLQKFLLSLLAVHSINIVTAQDLPINPDTKLVSVSNIITVDSVLKKDLQNRVDEWVNLNSNLHQTLLNVERTQKRRKKEKVTSTPNFAAEKKFSTDEKAIYFIMIDNTSKIGEMAQKFGKVIPMAEHTQCNLIFLFKDGKLKYEFTNFAHSSMDPVRNSSGGKYENEKPDADKRYMKKSYWIDLKSQTIEKVKLIAISLDQYIKKSKNNEMNF